MRETILRRVAVIASAALIIYLTVLLGHHTQCEPKNIQLYVMTFVGWLSAGTWGVSAWLSMEGTSTIEVRQRIFVFGSEWTNFFAAMFTASVVLLQLIYANPCLQ